MEKDQFDQLIAQLKQLNEHLGAISSRMAYMEEDLREIKDKVQPKGIL